MIRYVCILGVVLVVGLSGGAWADQVSGLVTDPWFATPTVGVGSFSCVMPKGKTFDDICPAGTDPLCVRADGLGHGILDCKPRISTSPVSDQSSPPARLRP